MRRLDRSSPVSPERWEGCVCVCVRERELERTVARRQRARHMSAKRSGTEMSPWARGLSVGSKGQSVWQSFAAELLLRRGMEVRLASAQAAPSAQAGDAKRG